MPLFVGIVLALASCAQQGAKLPEFPHYRPADDFLEMQRRLSNAESLELRARQREEALLRHRITSQREFAALQEQLARSEALQAESQAEMARGEERQSRRGFERYQNRMLSLRRAREETLLRRRITSQNEWAAIQEDLARSEALLVELARSEERQSRRGFERYQNRMLSLRRAREETLLRRRITSHDEWAAIQEDLARSEALLVEMARSEERKSRRGFERHQDRMLRLRRTRDEDLVRRRITSQREFAALQAQIARSEALQPAEEAQARIVEQDAAGK